jgi:hypothetical protein
VTHAEQLLDRASEADDPRQANRLRLEAQLEASAAAGRALVELEAAARIVEGAALEQLAAEAGRAFGVALSRLPPGRRSGVLALLGERR